MAERTGQDERRTDGSPSGADTQRPTRLPVLEPSQEVRFAVVMYGGISLAIYMNGIAQELRKLVRATAPAPRGRNEPWRAALTDADLRDSERVYRLLGRMLSRGEAPKSPEEAGDQPIRTRFVVDVLGGSSAGGINAVFLAKALANDEGMDELKDLWVREGDIEVLINDRTSVRDTGLRPQVPPRSLLNGTRMYRKLLDALEGMDASADAGASDDGPRSQNVEELDLYVTATDIEGQVVQLQLADRRVEEFRHRNVFHFCYSREAPDEKPRNDFVAANNPFLAFAARCTSAHPAAFEPMRLGDAEDVMGSRYSQGDREAWRRFYEDYLRTGDRERLAEGFLARDFNDGGVLDNRPFRQVTDALPLRHAEVPVVRKLVYLDPTPEHPRAAIQRPPRPTVAYNAWRSLSTLPRYEPIQDDLRRLLDRNRLVERVNSILGGMERTDFGYPRASEERLRSRERQVTYSDEQWDATTMTEMVDERGLAWAGYGHLRVTEVTDELALLVTRAAGLDDESDEFRAIRRLVRGWRERRFDPDGENGRLTEFAFLRRFDLNWRLRRLRYALSRTDEMLLGPQAKSWPLVQQVADRDPAEDPRVFEEFHAALLSIRAVLGGVKARLRASRERLWAPRAENPLRSAIDDLRISTDELHGLLDPQTAAVLEKRVERLLDAKWKAWETLERSVGGHLDRVIGDAARGYEEAVPGDSIGPDGTGTEIARRMVRYHYEDFASYDMISHPILYATGVGEEMAQVGVFRVSPEDATALVAETAAQPKLAGTKLKNFGAFFERGIRENDILWGRLDGAERIICALLPEHEPQRRRLVAAAHHAILLEEGKLEGKEGLPVEEALQSFRRDYEANYEATRRLDPERTLRSAARSSRVFGDLLDGYARAQRRLPRGGVVWITRLAQLFWTLVEVAVPNSLANIVFRHGLKLLYVFEALAIFLGTLLLYPTVQQFGFVAFALTATVHGAVLLLGDAMGEKEAKKRWWRAAKTAVVLLAALGLLLVLAALGLDLPQRLVSFAAAPTGAQDGSTATLARGAVMLAALGAAIALARKRTRT